MKNALEQIADIGILPVIKVEKLSDAVPLAAALRAGGVNAIEVTVRNDVAYDAICAIKATYPDMNVGAGTILTTDMAERALKASADFIVAPNFDPEVVAYCQKAEVPVAPCCVTGTEIGMAVKMGLRILKFFPSECNGGVTAIKLLAAPFASVRFVPTGGLDFGNLGSYLRCPAVAACGGSFMAKADAIRAGDWDGITKACKQAVGCSLGFELAHVGLNHPDAEAALTSAKALDCFFALGVKEGNSSIFTGKAVECMKTPFYGANGHIGFYCNSVPRALAWFRARQIPIREESVRTDAQGNMISFYLEEEINGFAVHVVGR